MPLTPHSVIGYFEIDPDLDPSASISALGQKRTCLLHFLTTTQAATKLVISARAKAPPNRISNNSIGACPRRNEKITGPRRMANRTYNHNAIQGFSVLGGGWEPVAQTPWTYANHKCLFRPTRNAVHGTLFMCLSRAKADSSSARLRYTSAVTEAAGSLAQVLKNPARVQPQE